MAQESNNLLSNSYCYNLQSYLSKCFKKQILLPDNIPTTSREYIRYLEDRIILPPRLVRTTNNLERRQENEQVMTNVGRSILLLKIIESPSFFLESNPVIIRKRNLKELMNVVSVFSNVNSISIKSLIYANFVSQYLVKDIPKVPNFPQINGYKFYKNVHMQTAIIQVLDYLLYLGFISKTMCENIIEYEKISKNRYDFVPHPAEKNLRYFKQFGICPYDLPIDVTLFSFLKNYFYHEDPERQINDPKELAHGPEIVKGISSRVIRYYSF